MVCCYWCILILIIIPTIRCCSLTGSLCGWSAVVLSDGRYPSFRNFDSTISIDAIRMKSYMDSLFDPTCVPVSVTINNLNFFPIRKMARFISVLRNCGGLRTSKPYISVMFFYPVLHRPPCFPDAYFATLTWNLIDDTVLFSWFKGTSHQNHQLSLKKRNIYQGCCLTGARSPGAPKLYMRVTKFLYKEPAWAPINLRLPWDNGPYVPINLVLLAELQTMELFMYLARSHTW